MLHLLLIYDFICMFFQTDFMLPAVTYFANTTDLFLPDIQLLAPTNVSSFLDKPVLFIPVFLKRNISIPPVTFFPLWLFCLFYKQTRFILHVEAGKDIEGFFFPFNFFVFFHLNFLFTFFFSLFLPSFFFITSF